MEKFKKSIALSLIMTLVIGLIPFNVVIGDVNRENETIHIESTYPFNNQENVEVNPLIEFKFKEKVELVDKDKIKISSNGDRFAVDLNKDAFVSFEGNTLKIDINSLDRSGKFNLRESTAYKVTLEKGAIKLKDKKDNLGQRIVNEEESLYFITGKDKALGNRGLRVEKYSSNTEGTDRINYMNSTQLDSDGNIYIHFNKNIQWNKYNEGINTDKQALKYFKLYRRPKEYKENGSYQYDIERKPVPNVDKEVDIESVELIKDNNDKNTNVLKIKPKNKLLNLNEYIIQINKKEILISFEDDVLNLNINQSIWTRPSNDKSVPKWDRDSSAQEIIEDENGPNKGYIIHGTPNYNKDKPIIIYVDREVILKPYEGSRSPLLDIEIYEFYEGSSKIEHLKDIEKYKIEYYMENGVKKTKLLFYPKDTLESGKEYKLNIKQGTFVTRGDMLLESINLSFVIEGDYKEEKGIYNVNITVNGERRTNELFDDYLYFEMDGNGEKNTYKHINTIGFELEGYNFTEDIEKIELIKMEDYVPADEGEKAVYDEAIRKEEKGKSKEDIPEKPSEDEGLEYPKKFDISTESVQFESVNKITGKFDEKTLQELSKASSLGKYDVIVTFKEPQIRAITKKTARSNGKNNSRISNKMRPCRKAPIIVSRYPGKDAQGVDHTSLSTVTVSFEDIYGDVVNRLGGGIISTDKTDGFKITELGSNLDLIERSSDDRKIKSIQRGGSRKIVFEIPIRTLDLKKGTTYEVTVPQDVVRCKHDYPVHFNQEETWQFTTTSESKAEKIYEGSVPENYDADYPMMIEGKDLKSGLVVKFKNVSTGKVYSTDKGPKYISSDSDDAKDKLMVYLPKADKLPVGLYNILIYSGSSLINEYSDDVFSVVENGKYVPNEVYRERDTVINNVTVKGNLKEVIKTSKNELELISRYTGSTLDLDSIIGEEVLTRDIKYDGSTISTLDTKSKWSNVKLIGLKRNTSNKSMTIRLGRAEPQVRDNINKRLKGENIKSEFIIVGGENYSAEKLNLTIPYKQSNGKNLKVLRYDEESRKINEIKVYDRDIDVKNKCVKIELVNALSSDNVTKGIFVVVE